MCRLSAFFGAPICAADLVTRPSRSIITQSFDARERLTGHANQPGYLNGDGFGLGWYGDNPKDVTPCVYRQARPAWNDPNLSSIAEKVYTPVLFAHVRAASQGLGVTETTCHPFRYGRYLWMHNGGLGNFAKVRRNLLADLKEHAFDFAVEHGGSDTALCFAVFLNLLGDPMAKGSPDHMRACLRQTLITLKTALEEIKADQTSLLNFVVSDGESLVASRYVIDLKNPKAQAASLYYASGNSYQPDGEAPGNYAMMHTDRRPSMVIVSSEPLTERRSDWVEVPRNACVVVTKSMHILVAGVDTDSDALVSRALGNLEGKSVVRRQSGRKPGVKTDVALEVPNAVGSTVRSTITIPGRTVLCCVVMGSLLVSGTDDGTIHVWDLKKSVVSEVLRMGQRPVLAMLADLDTGLLVCATSASVVAVYRLNADMRFQVSFVMCCDGTGDILSLTSIGNKIFAGFSDTKVRCIIDNVSNGFKYPQSGKISQAESCSEHDSFDEVTTTYTGREFPCGTNDASHYGHVFAMTSCLSGRFLCTGSGDGLLRIWDVETEECVQRRDDHDGAILALVAYEVQHGTMLISGSRDRSVKVWVWDGDNGFICKRTLRKHKDEVVFLSLCGDKLVSGSANGTVCVWCLETMALVCQYRDNSLKAGSVSKRYNLLFTASDEGAIQVRDFLSTEKDLGRGGILKGKAAVDKSEKITNGKSKSGVNGAMNNSQSTSSSEEEAFNGTGGRNTKGSGTINDPILTEVHEESDGAETLVPGVTNEMILAPPMSPLVGCGKGRSQLISTLLEDSDSTNTKLQNFHLDGNRALSQPETPSAANTGIFQCTPEVLERRLMQDVLARFVSFPTVSGREEHREDCWQGARYISNFLEGLGATVKFVSTAEDSNAPSGANPIVLAKFSSVNPAAKTVTFYGHYDVMPVDLSQWKSNPWSLTSIDGYFYGRGSTDNKGPIIAMIFAIKKLLEEKADGLGSNLVLVLQGEGEIANAGFKSCIQSHLHWFENTSLIVTSNSYWLGEEKPCITYGFRGVIELRVSVTGGSRNLHSGVDGGAHFEPMNDLITIVGTLVDSSGVVCIPGFYEDVRPLTDEDKELMKGVDFSIGEYRNATGVEHFTADHAEELLEARWRKPSVSITSIETSNVSGFYSIVPHRATAKISIRFVPDQDPSKIEKAVAAHLAFEIRKRRSPNKLSVECMNKGDWWLGDLSCPHFQIAAKAVRSVWGVDPEYVCEGGSMPLFSYLVKTLKAPLVQIPLGQSSDGAHLPNERIRSLNLFRGKEVLQRIIEEYAKRGL